METIDEVKQEVAEEYGYKSNSVFSAYEQIVINPHYISHDNLINIYDEVTARYATQFEDRIKELEDELGLVFNALEDIVNFGATKPTIEHAKHLIKNKETKMKKYRELYNKYENIIHVDSRISRLTIDFVRNNETEFSKYEHENHKLAHIHTSSMLYILENILEVIKEGIDKDILSEMWKDFKEVHNGQ